MGSIWPSIPSTITRSPTCSFPSSNAWASKPTGSPPRPARCADWRWPKQLGAPVGHGGWEAWHELPPASARFARRRSGRTEATHDGPQSPDGLRPDNAIVLVLVGLDVLEVR